MDRNLLTQETRSLLEAGSGYRDDAVYGDGVTDIARVTDYETFELGNTDIPATVLELHGDLLTDGEKEILERCASCGDDARYEFRHEFSGIIARIARKAAGCPDPQCLWLASREAVENIYHGSDIRKVMIPADACVLSDIGQYGALFAMDGRKEENES